MIDLLSHNDLGLDGDSARCLDRLCDQFEAAWKSGSRPKIEDYLPQAPAPALVVLFEFLLELELEYRQGCGDKLERAQYRARFPQWPAPVEAVFRKFEAPSDRPATPDPLRPEDKGLPGDQLFQVPTVVEGATPKETDPSQIAISWGPIEGPPTPSCGDTLGDYQLLEEIGAGGMGRVFKARNTCLQRIEAVKVIAPGIGASPAVLQRFLKERMLVAQANHPNVVVTHSGGEEKGIHYLGMEFIKGPDLQQLVQAQGPLPIPKAVDLVIQAARGLEHLHQMGVVHRDVKPSNLRLDAAGTVKVLDLGLARAVDAPQGDAEGSALTGRETILGTIDYMAPEQAKTPHQADHRADIYSLGCTLYYLLLGRPPFPGATVAGKLKDHETKPVPSLRSGRAEIPERLEAICHKMLAKKPSDRYASGTEVLADLQRVRSGAAPHSRIGRSRARWLLAGVSALGLLAVTLGILMWPRSGRESESLDNSAALAEFKQLIQEQNRQWSNALAQLPPEGPKNRETTPEGKNPRTPAVHAEPVGDLALPSEMADLEKKIRAARQKGDEKTESSLLLKASNTLVDRGYFSLAEKASLRMVELAGKDPAMRPIALGQLGLARYRGGQAEEAIDPLTEALDIYRDLYKKITRFPDTPQRQGHLSQLARMIGLTLIRLGNANKYLERYQNAKRAFEEGKEILERYDRKKELLGLLLSYGGMESSRGNYTQAIGLLEQGRTLAQGLKDRTSECEFLVNLGNAHARNGDNSGALARYQTAAGLLPAKVPYDLQSSLLLNWGQTLIEMGEWNEARNILEKLRSIVRDNDERCHRILQLLPALSGGNR